MKVSIKCLCFFSDMAALAKELQILRGKGILIVGSGNMVHNLGMVAWNKLNDTFGYDWAIEAGEKILSFRALVRNLLPHF